MFVCTDITGTSVCVYSSVEQSFNNLSTYFLILCLLVQAKLEVMEKNTETQSHLSTTSLSNQTMSDEDPRRSTPMAMKTADTAPSSDTLRLPSSVEDTPIVRNRSKSASLATSPSTSTAPIKSNQATVTQLSHGE